MKIEGYSNSKYPTSIFHLTPSGVNGYQSACPLFIWIPGNPGLLEYYEEFLQLVHNQNPEYEILGISHAGMNTGAVSADEEDSKVFSLEEQIDQKIDVINHFASPERPLILMGHSVGAYMVQKIVISKKLTGRVIKIGLLTPTIVDIHRSEKGILFTRAFSWIKKLPELAAWASNLAFNRMIPRTFIRPMLSLVMGCHRNSRAVITSSLLVRNPKFILQALGLAVFEMETIRDDWEFQKFLLDHCHKMNINIWMLFSHKDHWVSSETRRELIHFYKGAHDGENVSIQVSSEIPHSFVINHSKHVVDNYF